MKLVIDIKENTTNGDIIKAAFPNIEIFDENSIKAVWGRSESEGKWWNTNYKKDANRK